MSNKAIDDYLYNKFENANKLNNLQKDYNDTQVELNERN